MHIRTLQRLAVEALEDVKGKDIVVLNTRKLSNLFGRVIIATGDSTRQVRALAQRVMEKIKEAGGDVLGIEGEEAGEWVLVDLGDAVVHVMLPQARAYYDLESLWGAKPTRGGRRPAPANDKEKKKPLSPPPTQAG